MINRYAIPQSAEFTTREDGDNLIIEGYFAVFGGQYWLWEDAYETIEPGAFDLARDTDVRALTNHDTTLVLGRTTVGTLVLSVDERGLWGSVIINRADQDAVNLYERVKRGDVSQCSFGFDILQEDAEYNAGAPTVWHIREVKLWEVSVVTFPAYVETSVQARKDDYDNIVKRRAEAWRADAIRRLHGGHANGT